MKLKFVSGLIQIASLRFVKALERSQITVGLAELRSTSVRDVTANGHQRIHSRGYHYDREEWVLC